MTDQSIRAKLAFFDETMAKLQRIPQQSLDEFLARFELIEATLHLLQVAIQVLIDLTIYVTARLGLPAAPTSRAALEALEAAGHLPAGAADRFGPIFAFRNRVVHLYDRIDPQIVFAILRERREDLLELRRLLIERIA